jgi:hypothetical protein
MAHLYFRNFDAFTLYLDDQVLLLIIHITYIVKATIQLRFIPFFGPAIAILKLLVWEILVFAVFFFLQ